MTDLFVIDKSALARMTHPSAAARIAPLLVAGRAATTAIIDLEVLYSARSPSDYAEIRQRRDLAYTRIPIDEAVCRRAVEVQAELARTSQHRIPIPDLLIAAAAELSGCTVLHYDADYDRIARITRQPTEWVVPRGSV